MDKSRIPTVLISLLALLFFEAPAQAGDLYAYNASTPVYEKPDSELPPLHMLSYGAKVTVADEAMESGSEWIKGKIEAEALCVVAYARSDALLPLPAPDLSVSGFQSLINQLEQVGAATSERKDNVTTQTQIFDHGVTLSTRTFHTSYGDFEEQSLLVSDITIAQGFLLARAIVNQDGISSEQMRRVPIIEKDEQGHPFIFDETHWQIISVTQTQEGILISFPERAD
ncbi:MAG: hypothetical protein HEP70_12060 [Rhodobiaceae bacterium]|nr:hypothetical protein [Rhodobiaceae bacterium]